MELNRDIKQSVYKQIYTILQREINDGLYDEAGMLPSEKALCGRFGVERNTLRKALQILADEGAVTRRPGFGTVLGKPDVFAAQAGAPRQDGYAADGVRHMRKNILLITQEDYLHDNGESFHFKLINSFEKSISEMGYILIFKSMDMEGEFHDIIRNTEPAAIIYDSFIHDSLYNIGLDAGIPCISINHYTPLMTSVVSNNFDGAYSVAKLLIGAGHRRIAVITGKRNYQTSIERMSGVQRIYMKDGMAPEEILVLDGDWKFASGVEAGRRLLNIAEGERPTAVFAFNDDMAYGCYSYLQRMGVRIPEDISIAGFDMSDQYNAIFPMITTVDVNVDAMIAYTCWVLDGYLSGAAPVFSAKIQIDTTIIDNGTIRLCNNVQQNNKNSDNEETGGGAG